MGLSRFEMLQREIIACERCPRLVAHCREIARVKRRAYRDQEYWGRPVPSFGDPSGRLLIVGLAPAAHGANRSGRMFTGDSSGDWLYEALHRFGFASRASSTSQSDGLRLLDCVISAAAHCAPPGNRPTAEELRSCQAWMLRELEILDPQLVLVLGRIAWESWLRVLRARGRPIPRPRPAFLHGHLVQLDGSPPVLQSYHPSRQNTNTGRLSRRMWHGIFRCARDLLERQDPGPSAR